MPTGYTEVIENGGTFEEFVWTCARAMGACVTMRDEPFDAPIPEVFQPSPYYKERFNEGTAKIKAILDMTDDEVTKRQLLDNIKIRAFNEKEQARAERLRQRYEEILTKVEEWCPPSPDHCGLKEFMIQQIQLCRQDYQPYKKPEKPVLAPDEWRRREVLEISGDLAYIKESWEKEEERVAFRNLWLKQLRDSVPQPSKIKLSRVYSHDSV